MVVVEIGWKKIKKKQEYGCEKNQSD